ncbi:MAG: ATP-dependent DNA helicase RecG [Oscillospiraceae bacterium]|nr:ATP-dependent DNA helicase RecG [Oscillospiraceae bacterium]
MDINSPITELSGVGEKRAALYKKLNIFTVGDLLCHYPRSYIDYSSPVSIAESQLNEHSVIKARVIKKIPAARIRQGLVIYKVVVTDDSDNMTIVLYNNRFAYEALSEGEEYIFSGKVTGNLLRREMNTPIFIKASEPQKLRPVYSLTEGLTSNMVITNVTQALDSVDEIAFADHIPHFIRQKYSLAAFEYSLRNIHFPADSNIAEAAKKRLAFDELLTLQLGMFLMKSRSRTLTGCKMSGGGGLMKEFQSGLPFELTLAQVRASEEIIADMCRDYPMNRLVQGDVGSGKTAVAAAAALFAQKNGCQTALMAPTEILARQHYKTLTDLLAPHGVKVCCLTGSLTPKQRKVLGEQIANGEFDVITGTHALISGSTEFKRLGLVIMDEQHRFGVNQRARLAEKGENPHRLVMSATPIPRTLALIIYGDLDISVLDELPKGRRKIETFAVTDKLRSRACGFVKKQIDEGRQAYIVCPMIEEGESELVSAKGYAEKLAKGEFNGYTIGILHGKMSSQEKDEVMGRFKSGEIQLLVATTVVEVGVDVPNASVIMIENAERFGLSQLHQLRGRVGRGQYQSYCILVAGAVNDEIRERLKIMTETSDGFKISEYDLKLRGAGDFFGERQHGLPEMRIADAAADRELISKAQNAAKDIMEESPDLSKFPLLKSDIDRMFSSGAAEAL